MNAQTDQQLLQNYAGSHSEPAFAELVRRHIDLVHSAALRMVCDAHLAEDVTQDVFVALAQNARQLTQHPVLSGWLHRTTQNLAANAVRTNVRRQTREQEAVVMNELLSAEPDTTWEHIAPHLDAALGELSEPDRDALLLRYFERKSAHEMAQTLGISDDAAQKRVSRAVERLRELFAKRGVTVGASGLAVVISANAVQAVPVGLALTIATAAALTGTTLTTTATVTTPKAIAMTALQKTVLVGGLICITALITFLVYPKHANPAVRPANKNPVVKTHPPESPKKAPAPFWRRVDSIQTASILVEKADDEMRDTLARLKDALYAPKSSGSRSDDPAYKLLYSIPLEKRAAALAMVRTALRDQNQAVCRRAISLIPLIWPQGETALPDLYDLIRTKSQQRPGLASDALMAAVQVRSETDVIPELVLAAMHGGIKSQQEFALQFPIIQTQVKDGAAAFATSLQPYLNSLDASTRLTAAQLLAQLPGAADKNVVATLAASLDVNSSGQITDDQIRTSLNALLKMGVNARDAVPALAALGDSRPDLEDSVMTVLKAIVPDELKGLGVATPLPTHDEQSQNIAQVLANGTLTLQGAIDALKDPLMMLPTARALADFGPNAAAALPALRDALATSYTTNPNSAMVLASVIERLDPEQPKPLLMAWDVLPALNAVNSKATKDNIAGLDNTLATLREKLPIGLLFNHDDIRQLYAALKQLDPRLAGVFQTAIASADSKFTSIFENTDR